MPSLLESLGTNVKTKLNLKADLASPTFTGSVTTPDLEITQHLTLSESTPEIIADNGQLIIGNQGIAVDGNSVFNNDLDASAGTLTVGTVGGNATFTGTVGVDGTLTANGDAIITGDLTVNGSSFEANSTYVTEDPITEKNKGADIGANNVKDIGFVGIRGSSEQNIFLGFDEGVDAIVAKYLDESGTITDVSTGTNVAEMNWKIPGANLIVEGTEALGTLQDFIDALNA